MNDEEWVIIHVTKQGDFVISGTWPDATRAHMQVARDGDPNCVKHMVRKVYHDPASEE